MGLKSERHWPFFRCAFCFLSSFFSTSLFHYLFFFLLLLSSIILNVYLCICGWFPKKISFSVRSLFRLSHSWIFSVYFSSVHTSTHKHTQCLLSASATRICIFDFDFFSFVMVLLWQEWFLFFVWFSSRFKNSNCKQEKDQRTCMCDTNSENY